MTTTRIPSDLIAALRRALHRAEEGGQIFGLIFAAEDIVGAAEEAAEEPLRALLPDRKETP